MGAGDKVVTYMDHGEDWLSGWIEPSCLSCWLRGFSSLAWITSLSSLLTRALPPVSIPVVSVCDLIMTLLSVAPLEIRLLHTSHPVSVALPSLTPSPLLALVFGNDLPFLKNPIQIQANHPLHVLSTV